MLLSFVFIFLYKLYNSAGCWWLTPVILATQEAEIRRIKVPSQPGQAVHKTLSRKNLPQKRAGGVAQGVGPEFKLQYHTHKKNCTILFSSCPNEISLFGTNMSVLLATFIYLGLSISVCSNNLQSIFRYSLLFLGNLWSF
jgi:hypothetical protein